MLGETQVSPLFQRQNLKQCLIVYLTLILFFPKSAFFHISLIHYRTSPVLGIGHLMPVFHQAIDNMLKFPKPLAYRLARNPLSLGFVMFPILFFIFCCLPSFLCVLLSCTVEQCRQSYFLLVCPGLVRVHQPDLSCRCSLVQSVHVAVYFRTGAG